MKKAALVLFAVFVAVTFTFTMGRLPTVPPEELAAPVGQKVEAPTLAFQPALDRTSAGLVTPAQMANGAKVYRTLCVSCHMPDGKGMFTAVPPLTGSDYMLADRERAIRGVLKGVSGPITVNQVHYNAVMPPLEAVLTDRQIADVLTYVFNSWSNQGDAFDPHFVGSLRASAAVP